MLSFNVKAVGFRPQLSALPGILDERVWDLGFAIETPSPTHPPTSHHDYVKTKQRAVRGRNVEVQQPLRQLLELQREDACLGQEPFLLCRDFKLLAFEIRMPLFPI